MNRSPFHFSRLGLVATSAGLSLVTARASYPTAAPLPPPGVREIATGPFKANWESFQQYRCPEWFRDAKFGIWAHWGPQCEPEQGDWYARRMYEEGSAINQYHVAHYGHPSQYGFKDVIKQWHAANWQPDELMARFKRAGAKFFVAMAVHHDNFDLYDSKYQPWNSVNVGPKTDIVARWQAAARRAGLRFGVSDHAAATLNWWASSLGGDKSGPLAGVPYDGRLTKADGRGQWWDGLDPRELYPPLRPEGGKVAEPDRELFIQRWFMRARDLIDKYQPDYFYHDWSNLPYGQVGMDLMAHYYNTTLAARGGMDVVMTAKNLKGLERAAMVNDVERGASDRLEKYPWETGTCIGDWHYSRALFEKHGYKTVAQITQALADVVSKNGTLLLSIPIKGDGTIDADEVAFLDGLGAWMEINGEAIYGTRPWKVFGEGPTQIKAGDMGENDLHFTSEDIRFTTKGETLYAIALVPPTSAALTIRSLAAGAMHDPGEIGSIELLGSRGKLAWQRNTDGLVVNLANRPLAATAIVLKITRK